MSLKSSFSLRHSYAGTPRPLVLLARASYAASLLSALLAAAPLAAQQAPGVGNANANGNTDAIAPPGAAKDGSRGVGKEDSLLGGPAAYRDPYPSTLDAGDAQRSDLMRTERVPNGTTNGNGYGSLPPGGGARAAGAGVGGASGGNAAPNAEQATQSLYRDPFGGAKGNEGQINRSPW